MGTACAIPVLINSCYAVGAAAVLGLNPPFTIYSWFVYRL